MIVLSNKWLFCDKYMNCSFQFLVIIVNSFFLYTILFRLFSCALSSSSNHKESKEPIEKDVRLKL